MSVQTISADTIIELLKANIESLKDLNLSEDDSLIASGLIESLDLINFLAVLESCFGIQLELDMLDIESFETPNRMAEMLNKINIR